MSLEQEVATLKTQLAALVAQNEVLKARTQAAEEKEANKLIDGLLEVIEHGDKLESDFINLVDQIESDQLLIDLSEVNNPSSDVLGFKFTDIILKAGHKHFMIDLAPEDRTRFKDTLLNVVKNPLIKAILTTNPVSYLVSKVVEKVSDFTESVKGKPKERLLSVKKAFGQQKLEAFVSEMEQYFPFYESLLNAADTYEVEVDSLKEKYNHLESRLDNYYAGFLGVLGLDPDASQPLLRQVQERFTPEKVDGIPDFRPILDDENNQEAYKIALKFPELKEQIQALMAEYRSILSNFLKDNLEALEIAKNLSPDKAGLEKLETRIQKALNEL